MRRGPLAPWDDEPQGECPTCKGVTYNGEEDAHEDDGHVYRSWSWLNCDDCKAYCPTCGDSDCAKEGGYCIACNTHPSEDVSWASMDKARNLLADTRALLARFT